MRVSSGLPEAENIKRRKRDDGPTIGFLERAYTNEIVTKIMGCSGKQKKKRNSEQTDFKKAVLKYYSSENRDAEAYFCHVMGRLDAKLVKCAHLGPKSISGNDRVVSKTKKTAAPALMLANGLEEAVIASISTLSTNAGSDEESDEEGEEDEEDEEDD
ncbi:hypothetical protein FQN54_006304 [Arachnomyces sp. PD_36]|nr:hypothetical protein FQN54_006304 [Arachnomyces sp. PD_36]